MAIKYQRTPLEVEAKFLADGGFKPKRIIYHDRAFEITRVLRVRKHAPTTVPCIAPLEYAVIVDGKERKLYYEREGERWFSIKEVQVPDEEGAGNPAQRR